MYQHTLHCALAKYSMVCKKTCHFCFLNSSVKHWAILIIFGVRHQEETWCKWL